MKTTAVRWAAALVIAGGLFAQAPTVKRTVVTRADISMPGREAVIVNVEIPPGGTTGLHTHFGEEISYLTLGEGHMTVEGQPARTVKAGEGFIIPNGAKHEMKNEGSQTLKLVAVFTVEKGKALTTPAQ